MNRIIDSNNNKDTEKDTKKISLIVHMLASSFIVFVFLLLILNILCLLEGLLPKGKNIKAARKFI